MASAARLSRALLSVGHSYAAACMCQRFPPVRTCSEALFDRLLGAVIDVRTLKLTALHNMQLDYTPGYPLYQGYKVHSPRYERQTLSRVSRYSRRHCKSSMRPVTNVKKLELIVAPKQIPKPEHLHRGFMDLAMYYQRRFEVAIPPLNSPIILYRHIKRLAIPSMYISELSTSVCHGLN